MGAGLGVGGAAAALDAADRTTRWRYDALGRAIEVVGPSGQVVTPAYGRAGGLIAVAVDGVRYVDLVVRNARGQRVLVAYGNGLMTRYGYDRDTSRLRRLRTERAAVAGGTSTGAGAPLQNVDHDYDLVGNLIGLIERTPGCGVAGTLAGRNMLARVFRYDGFGRLVSATGRACANDTNGRPLADVLRCRAVATPFSGGPAVPSQANGPDLTRTYVETYRYDEVGNLLDLGYRPTSGPVTTGWHRLFGVSGRDPGDSAGARDNRVSRVRNPGIPEMTMRHDEAGYLIAEGDSRTYRWDHAGRLAEFTVVNGANTSVRARYLYDAAGRRIKKWVRHGPGGNDESVVYHNGLSESHAWTKAGGGRADLLHVLDGDVRVATHRAGDRHPDDFGPPVRYELADHLGSATIVVDTSGIWVSREEYSPFGETNFGGFAASGTASAVWNVTPNPGSRCMVLATSRRPSPGGPRPTRLGQSTPQTRTCTAGTTRSGLSTPAASAARAPPDRGSVTNPRSATTSAAALPSCISTRATPTSST